MVCQIIPFPQELRPQLPTIVGNVDYLTLRQRLEQIDTLLRDSGVERDFVQRALAGWTRAAAGEPRRSGGRGGGSVWDRQPWWTISRHLEQIGKGRAVSTAHRPRSSFRHTPQRNGSVAVNIE